MFENRYPYTSYSEYNLDWIIAEIRKMHKDWDDFKILNTIRFEGEWDITKQYPEWSLVTDNNIGYISVQPVPAGVDILESDYWKEVYNYSTIIPNIMSRIVAIENDIDNNIDPAISTLQSDVSDIQSDITTLQNLITEHDRTIICIGDSYGLNNAGWSGWGYELDALLPDSTVYVTAEGGSGFIGDSNYDNYLEQLQNITSSIPDPDAVTDIIIGGGYNDVSTNQTEADLLVAMTDFMDYATTTFPFASVSFGFLGVDYNTAHAMQGKLNSAALVTFPSLCSQVNMKYIKNANAILLNKSLLYYVSADPNNYFHPSTTGCQEIAKKLLEYLVSGYFDVRYAETFGGLQVYAINGDIDIFINDLALRNTAFSTIPFNTWTATYSLYTNSDILWGTNSSYTCFMFSAGLTDYTGGFKGNVRLRFLEKQVWLINDTVPGGMTIGGGGFYIDLPSVHIPLQAGY